MARRGVRFELERFGWAAEGSVLEVAGRWRGPRPRRLGPATLAVEAEERRRLAPTIVMGDARADPEPTLWRAEYRWDRGAVGSFELDVGSNLIIELPAPEGSPPDGAPFDQIQTDPARAELEAAHRQIEATRVETGRLRDELVTLRRDALQLEQITEFLRLAQATAEAERVALRAAREDVASRRAAAAAELEAGGQPEEPARAGTAALRLAVEQARGEAAAALGDAERAREELLKARASASASAEEILERERALGEERDSALKDARGLRDRLAAAEARPDAPPESPGDGPDTATPSAPIPSSEPEVWPASPWVPSQAGAPTHASRDDAADTLVLESPRRRRAVPQHRERVMVVPQRTAPVARRYAQRPPKDSPALRAIAGVLLLLLAIVLVTLLVIVA